MSSRILVLRIPDTQSQSQGGYSPRRPCTYISDIAVSRKVVGLGGEGGGGVHLGSILDIHALREDVCQADNAQHVVNVALDAASHPRVLDLQHHLPPVMQHCPMHLLEREVLALPLQ